MEKENTIFLINKSVVDTENPENDRDEILFAENDQYFAHEGFLKEVDRELSNGAPDGNFLSENEWECRFGTQIIKIYVTEQKFITTDTRLARSLDR